MDLNKYTEEICLGLTKAYPNVEITESLGNELKTQILSGYVLGLSDEQIICMLDPSINYFKREILKLAFALELPENRVMELKEQIRNTDDAVKENVILLLRLWNDNAVNENVLSIQSNMSNMMSEYKNQIEAIKKENKEMNILNQTLRERDDEVQMLKNSLSQMEKNICEREKEMEKQIKEQAKELAERMAERKYKEYIFNEEVKKQDAEKLEKKIRNEYEEKYGELPKSNKKKKRFFSKKEVEKSPELKIKELPKDFSLAAYICSSNLSSSQMEIITVAVRLGVNESLIKQMIDSNQSAAQMKQALEIIVTQMQKEQRSEIEFQDGNEYDLFENNLEN